MAAQAQKHVTHNEAIRTLDAVVQLSVGNRDLATPPASPLDGDRYIVGPSATGDWSGHDGEIAAFQDNAWMHYAPLEGWLCWIMDEDKLLVWDGSVWSDVSGSAGGSVNPAALVGVNTTADDTNKLSVKSDAVLFSHDDITPGSGDQRTVLNKAGTANTASFLFQSNWQGHAEFGLIGNDNWALKYSSNGTDWAERIIVDSSKVTIQEGLSLEVGPHHMSTVMTSGNAAMEISAGIPGDRFAYFDFHASDTQPDYSSRFIRFPGADSLFVIENSGNGPISLRPSGGASLLGAGGLDRSAQENDSFKPLADNAYSLGANGFRWSSIWAANGTIQTSDERDKVIESRVKPKSACAMVDMIEPALFRWKIGSNEVVVTDRKTDSMNPDNPNAKTIEDVETEIVEKPGERLHAGFIAQEFKAALDEQGLDFGAWGLEDINDPDSKQWLRPDQLTAVLWAALKETRSELHCLRKGIQPDRPGFIQTIRSWISVAKGGLSIRPLGTQKAD